MQRVLVREVQVAYRESRTSSLSGARVFPNDYRYRSRRNPRLWVLLRREGWLVNKKLVYRLYCEEGLGIMRKKPRRRKSVLAS